MRKQMNYEIKLDETKTFYRILETKTNQYIADIDNVINAQVIKTNLNRGGGFDGFTPPFFMTPKNIFISR